jgi:hypothetical protein
MPQQKRREPQFKKYFVSDIKKKRVANPSKGKGRQWEKEHSFRAQNIHHGKRGNYYYFTDSSYGFSLKKNSQ